LRIALGSVGPRFQWSTRRSMCSLSLVIDTDAPLCLLRIRRNPRTIATVDIGTFGTRIHVQCLFRHPSRQYFAVSGINDVFVVLRRLCVDPPITSFCLFHHQLQAGPNIHSYPEAPWSPPRPPPFGLVLGCSHFVWFCAMCAPKQPHVYHTVINACGCAAALQCVNHLDAECTSCHVATK
jgi:hypothetical protein